MQFLQDSDTYIQNRSEYTSKGLVYYSQVEEIINSISHLLAGVVGLSIMIYTICHLTSPVLILAAVMSGIFCAFPYFISAFYHFIKNTDKKSVARKIDHAGVCFIVLACGLPLCLGMTVHIFDIVAIVLCTAIAFSNIIMSLIDLKKFSRLMMILDVVIALLLTVSYFINRSTVPANAKWAYIIGAAFCLMGFAFFGRKKQYMHSAFHILMFAGTTACMHAGMFILL